VELQGPWGRAGPGPHPSSEQYIANDKSEGHGLFSVECREHGVQSELFHTIQTGPGKDGWLMVRFPPDIQQQDAEMPCDIWAIADFVSGSDLFRVSRPTRSHQDLVISFPNARNPGGSNKIPFTGTLSEISPRMRRKLSTARRGVLLDTNFSPLVLTRSWR